MTSLGIRCLIIRKWSKVIILCIITENPFNPRVLFSTLNSVIDSPVSDFLDVSLQTCENFKHFIEKIADARSSI